MFGLPKFKRNTSQIKLIQISIEIIIEIIENHLKESNDLPTHLKDHRFVS